MTQERAPLPLDGWRMIDVIDHAANYTFVRGKKQGRPTWKSKCHVSWDVVDGRFYLSSLWHKGSFYFEEDAGVDAVLAHLISLIPPEEHARLVARRMSLDAEYFDDYIPF